MKSFHDFETTIAIKNEAIILIQKSDKIYNVMEGLDILTYFPPESKTSTLYIAFLSRFFEDEYPNNERFNLTRHLQLLPGLCKFAKEISISVDQQEKWNNFRNEILFLIYGTQNPNGSWGYFPQHFSPDFVLNSPLKKEWRSLDPSSKNRLSAKCTSMRDYYVNSRRVDENKATNSIVWTAYCLITLMDAFEDTQESEMAITRGVRFLLENQNKSGGWGFNKGNEPNMSATCIALVALFRAFRLQLTDIQKDQLKGGCDSSTIKSLNLPPW